MLVESSNLKHTDSISVLVCDDDSLLRKRLSKTLRDRGFLVFEASLVSEAKEVLMDYKINVCIIDMRMPGENGLLLLDFISHNYPRIRTIVYTGFGSIQNAKDAVKMGAYEYFTKPVNTEVLISSILNEEVSINLTKEEPEMPSLEEVEMDYIVKVLDECEGNISAAAKVLGLHRRSLQRKLKDRK